MSVEIREISVDLRWSFVKSGKSPLKSRITQPKWAGLSWCACALTWKIFVWAEFNTTGWKAFSTPWSRSTAWQNLRPQEVLPLLELHPSIFEPRPPDTRSSRVRLPKLQLRSFGGDLTKWTSFWESFESAVHSNGELSDIEKFNYLNSLLERSTREAVSGLALTSANYHKAVDTLQKRFGCKQQIVNKHMDALLQVDAVTSSQNTRALRKLFDYISCHIRSLKSLGIESDSYGGLLCPVLLNKIPADLQLIISRKVSGADWKLDLLMEAIEEEITARERVSAGQSRPPAWWSTSEQKPPPTATALVSGEPSNVQMPCCYCDQLHSPNDCNSVTHVDARK